MPPTTSAITGTLLADLPPDTNSIYSDPDGTGTWQHFVIWNHYEKDRKIYQLGISSPGGFQGQSVAFVQLAAPTLLWICDWSLARVGSPPIVPDPLPEVSSWVLLDDWWTTEPIEVAGADGVLPSFLITGTYIYGHPNPQNNTNQHVIYPITPWLDGTILTGTVRTVPDALLTKGLADFLATSALGSGVANGGGGGGSQVGPSGQGIVH